MARKRKPAAPCAPKAIYSLTQRQAEWLRTARDTDGGAYLGSMAGPDIYELIEAGAATCREDRRSGGSRWTHDPRPCEWTESYLVPTELGLELLGKVRT